MSDLTYRQLTEMAARDSIKLNRLISEMDDAAFLLSLVYEEGDLEPELGDKIKRFMEKYGYFIPDSDELTE